MVCKFGKCEKINSGTFFICYHEDNYKNSCRYSKWCRSSNKFVTSTDKYGRSCKNFEIEKGSGI